MLWRKIVHKVWVVLFILTASQPAMSAEGGVIKPADETGRQRFVKDNLFGVDFVDADHGWVTGYYGTVLRTDDGGKAWQLSAIGSTELLRRVDFIDENTGWAVGHRGSIFHTIDGGQTWDTQHQSPDTYLRDISFIDRNVGWAVGHNATILHTKDGGQTWVNQELANYVGRDIPRLSGIAAFDAAHAIAVGEFGTVAVTADGGATWIVVPQPAGSTTYTAVATARDFAVAVGLDGVAIIIPRELVEAGAAAGRSSSKMTALSVPTKNHIFDVALRPDGQGFLVGQSAILNYDGRKLEQMEAQAERDMRFSWYGGVALLPAGGAVVVGIQGLILELDQASNKFAEKTRWKQ